MQQIIFEPAKIRQEMTERLAKLSSRNAKLWLEDQVEKLSERTADRSEKYRRIIAAIKLYVLFPSPKLSANRLILQRALKACESLVISVAESDALHYTLNTHLGNLYVSNSLFFEALECFQKAATYDLNEENRLVCLLNRIRCKLWLRDFRDVGQLLKEIKVFDIVDNSLRSVVTAVNIRLDLLLGNTVSAREALDRFAQKNPSIELKYLDLIASMMQHWGDSTASRFERFLQHSALPEKDKTFYQLEAAILSSLQDLKRGRVISTTTQRRLASLREKVGDYHLQECAKVLLLFIKHDGQALSRKLSMYQRMSAALSQLLFGANDFMYQFASSLWLDYLWAKSQKTEFARYYIGFKGYAEKLKFEIRVDEQNTDEWWLFARIQEFQNRYENIGRETS